MIESSLWGFTFFRLIFGALPFLLDFVLELYILRHILELYILGFYRDGIMGRTTEVDSIGHVRPSFPTNSSSWAAWLRSPHNNRVPHKPPPGSHVLWPPPPPTTTNKTSQVRKLSEEWLTGRWLSWGPEPRAADGTTAVGASPPAPSMGLFPSTILSRPPPPSGRSVSRTPPP